MKLEEAKAIDKCIEKWMGIKAGKRSFSDGVKMCELCKYVGLRDVPAELRESRCKAECPLGKAGQFCIDTGSIWKRYSLVYRWNDEIGLDTVLSDVSVKLRSEIEPIIDEMIEALKGLLP